MPHTRPRNSRFVVTACCLAGLMVAAPAAAQAPSAGVYRCGNQYSDSPCPGGKAVMADDARSADQQQQARAAVQRDAKLAEQLRAERRAREQAAVGQRAARIGPEPAKAAKTAASHPQADKPKRKKHPDKTDKPPRKTAPNA